MHIRTTDWVIAIIIRGPERRFETNARFPLSSDELPFFLDAGNRDIADIQNDQYDPMDVIGEYILFGETILDQSSNTAYVYDDFYAADTAFAALEG